MVKQQSLLGELPTPIQNEAHFALAEGLEVLAHLLVIENARYDESEHVKEERDRFLNELNAYKM